MSFNVDHPPAFLQTRRIQRIQQKPQFKRNDVRIKYISRYIIMNAEGGIEAHHRWIIDAYF